MLGRATWKEVQEEMSPMNSNGKCHSGASFKKAFFGGPY